MNALSRYSQRWRPIDVWRDKISPPRQAQDEQSTVDQKRGIYDEPGLRRWYEDEYDCEVEETGTLFHSEHDLVLATPDGLIHPRDGSPEMGLEIKSPRLTKLQDWYPEGFREPPAIPRYYWPQLTWEAAVLRVGQVAMWARLGDEPRRLLFDFNQNFFDGLLYIAEKFWRDHVVTGVPPSPDASDSYGAYLKERFPNHDPDADLKPSTPEDLAAAKRYANGHALVKLGETEKQAARNLLEASMGEYPGIDFGDLGRVTNRNQKDKEVVDYKALLADPQMDPALIQKHTITKAGPRSFSAAAFKGKL